MEMITCSLVTTSLISPNTRGSTWGFTARTRYFACLAHSALEPTWGTPVSLVIFSIFSSWAEEKIISSGENSFKSPFMMAVAMLPIPIKPIFAISIPS